MASLIDSLIEVLDEENKKYSELLDLSKNKTTAIVGGDINELQVILGKEQKIIEELNKIEANRISAVADICKILQLSPNEIKVEQIVQLLEKKPKEHDALQKVYLELKRTVDQLTKINDHNRVLLQESMDMIDFELNLARNAAMSPQTNNYGKSAMEAQSGMGRGSFDAKQ